MSEANVDRFIELAETFNRLAETPERINPEAMRALLGVMDSAVQFEPQQAALEGRYVGHDGVIQWLADLVEHYAGGHMDLSDIRDLEDRVLALGTLRITGRSSGIETDVPLAVVASFQNGLITEFKDYGEKDQALEAVGLSE